MKISKLFVVYKKEYGGEMMFDYEMIEILNELTYIENLLNGRISSHISNLCHRLSIRSVDIVSISSDIHFAEETVYRLNKNTVRR